MSFEKEVLNRMPREAHPHLAEWAALVGADLPDYVLGDERENGRRPRDR